MSSTAKTSSSRGSSKPNANKSKSKDTRRPPRTKVTNGESKRTESPLSTEREGISASTNSSSQKKRPKSAKSKKPNKQKTDDKDIDAINAEINESEKRRLEKKAEKERKNEKSLKTTKPKVLVKKPEKPEELKPTKIIIRNLPPCCTSESLLEILERGFLPPYNYYNFCAADISLIPWHSCRAYFNFKTLDEALQFYQEWDNRTFTSQDARHYHCEVEVAPHQKLPADKSTMIVEKCTSVLELRREMGISAKIFNSLEYHQYLGKAEAPSSTNEDDGDGGTDPPTTASKMEAFMEMLEARKSENDSTKKSPLCLYLEEEREKSRPVRLKPAKAPKRETSSKKGGSKDKANGDGEPERERRPPRSRNRGGKGGGGKGKGDKSTKRGGGGK